MRKLRQNLRGNFSTFHLRISPKSYIAPLFLVLLLFMTASVALERTSKAADSASSSTEGILKTPHPKSDRQKVIDFDGDLVEGMNKSPYDSLNQVSESKKKRKTFHLYRKRKGFRTEIQDSLKKMRSTP